MELLDLREKRDHFEKELLEKYNGTLLTLRANFPGEDKRHEKADIAVRILYEEIRKHFNPIHEERIRNAEGLILFLLLKEKSVDVKRKIIEIEEHHPLGRLLDMDVRDETKIWSRRDFDLPGRKCYLCENLAVHCVRSEKHRKEEIIEHFIKRVNEYIE
ncbi:MAG TPA: citrate lyase holo-[acyl-carrier protein] synthase [Proteiniclasticum sp.]|nr:citrate lyase holo-[acyl-carrier protein] synthase [Proteiniclasticum sp.]